MELSVKFDWEGTLRRDKHAHRIGCRDENTRVDRKARPAGGGKTCSDVAIEVHLVCAFVKPGTRHDPGAMMQLII